MRFLAGLALAMAMAVAPPPASASESQDFQGCDGRMKPGRRDDGMRDETSNSGFGFLGVTDAKIQSTRALASTLLLPTQKLRRAHLLRARRCLCPRGDMRHGGGTA